MQVRLLKESLIFIGATLFFLGLCATVGISTSTPPTSPPAKAAHGDNHKTKGAAAQVVEAILPYELSMMKSHPPLCRPARRDSGLEVAPNPGLTPLGSIHTVPPCGTREAPVHGVKRFGSSIPRSMGLSSH